MCISDWRLYKLSCNFATFKPRICFIMIPLVAHHLNTSFSSVWCISEEHFRQQRHTQKKRPKKWRLQNLKGKEDTQLNDAQCKRSCGCFAYELFRSVASTILLHLSLQPLAISNGCLLAISLSLSLAWSSPKCCAHAFSFVWFLRHQKSVLVAAALRNGIRRIKQVHANCTLKKKRMSFGVNRLLHKLK